MIFTDLSGSKIEDNMTPKFTITTPNGQTIEGYECTCNIFSSDVECPNPTECALFEDSIVGVKLKLFDITEEQAKKWGYANGKKITGTFQRSCAEYFSAKRHFENVLKDNIDAEQDLSNILLILIEE